MFISNCSKCCFLQDSRCVHGQLCTSTPKGCYTTGFCRLYRNKEWAAKQDTTPEKLIQLSVNGSKFKYTLVVIYSDEKSIETLEKNISYLAYNIETSLNTVCKQIIIADVTDTLDRTKIFDCFRRLLKYVTIPIKLDVLTAGTEEPEDTIKRLRKEIKEKYFVVIPSTKNLLSLDNEIMTKEINDRQTRFIFWPFANKFAGTIIHQLVQPYGLYITCAYKEFVRPQDVPLTFDEHLKKMELLTGIYLSSPLNIVI